MERDEVEKELEEEGVESEGAVEVDGEGTGVLKEPREEEGRVAVADDDDDDGVSGKADRACGLAGERARRAWTLEGAGGRGPFDFGVVWRPVVEVRAVECARRKGDAKDRAAEVDAGGV